jgi:hypothetical protein
MNSVGHMAAVGRANENLDELACDLGFEPRDQSGDGKVRSLSRALVLAMQTIKNASTSMSGKATELIEVAQDPRAHTLACPSALPHGLARYSHCSYRGWYHTDVTLPRVYFRPDVDRPADVAVSELDFTYLFDERVQNPDFYTTGRGLQIREGVASVKDAAEDKLRAVLGARFIGEEVGETQAHQLRKQFGLEQDL